MTASADLDVARPVDGDRCSTCAPPSPGPVVSSAQGPGHPEGGVIVVAYSTCMEPFTPRPGVVVPRLLRPAEHVEIDPATQGGHPVITGTRVPYEAVAELLEDGVQLERIQDYYPSVSPEAARDAAAFARYVDSYAPGSHAA